MRAADFIITKAGPGQLPKHSTRTFHYLVFQITRAGGWQRHFCGEEGAGVWAPKPQEVVRYSHAGLEGFFHAERRQQVIENCIRVARPEAPRLIARSIGKLLGL